MNEETTERVKKMRYYHICEKLDVDIDGKTFYLITDGSTEIDLVRDATITEYDINGNVIDICDINVSYTEVYEKALELINETVNEFYIA